MRSVTKRFAFFILRLLINSVFALNVRKYSRGGAVSTIAGGINAVHHAGKAAGNLGRKVT